MSRRTSLFTRIVQHRGNLRPPGHEVAEASACIEGANPVCGDLGDGVGRLRVSRRKLARTANVLLITALVFGLNTPSRSYASTLTVCASGCSATTIAAAIAAASDGDIISVQYAVDYETVPIVVSKSVTISGASADNTAIRPDASGTGPVFSVSSGVSAEILDLAVELGSNVNGSGGGILNNGTLELRGVAVSGNSSGGGGGGGIENIGTLSIFNSQIQGNTATFSGGGSGGGVENFGTLTMTNSTVSNNKATNPGGGGGFGGGISNSATLTITNSTIANNSAAANSPGVFGTGGGIFAALGTTTISFSTITGNNAEGDDSYPANGGGIHAGAPVTIKNSIVGNNFLAFTGGTRDCSGTVNAQGTNLDTDGSCGSTNFANVTVAGLGLGSIALNAPGITETVALEPGSVAIDRVTDCTDVSGNPVASDERGVTRPQGPACDVGSYEWQGPTFFTGEAAAGQGWYYLAFPDGNPFGYYDYNSWPWLYHADMGFEYVVESGNAAHGVDLYDELLAQWFYTDPASFPLLYNFSADAWYWYEPAQDKPGHYTSNPRWFFNMTTKEWIHSP